jgi:flagellar protein FliS
MLASMTRGAAAYYQTQVQTQSPLELVVMLYDGALRFMRTAAEAMARRDLTAKRDAISRALAIVSELQSTLNMTEGGEIAASLDALYTYVNGRLLDANIKGDADGLHESVRLLASLREAWAEVARTGGRVAQ